jgi:hypothetical protein
MLKCWTSSFRLFGREDARPPPRSRRRVRIGYSFLCNIDLEIFG